MARRLALFLDGTTDTEAGNTNVWRLKSLCINGMTPDGVEQKVFYSVGVGTALGEKYRGGAFGYGIDDVVVAAYQWLIETYEEGDVLFIFGFSRGAYTARSLAGFISRCGVIKLGAPLSIKQLYDRYRQGDNAFADRTAMSVAATTVISPRRFRCNGSWARRSSTNFASGKTRSRSSRQRLTRCSMIPSRQVMSRICFSAFCCSTVRVTGARSIGHL